MVSALVPQPVQEVAQTFCTAAGGSARKDRAMGDTMPLANHLLGDHRVARPPGGHAAPASDRAMVITGPCASAATRVCMVSQRRGKQHLDGRQYARTGTKQRQGCPWRAWGPSEPLIIATVQRYAWRPNSPHHPFQNPRIAGPRRSTNLALSARSALQRCQSCAGYQ